MEVEEPEVMQGCERAMMRICPPCPFGTGKTRVLFWQGQSSPYSRVTLFAITGTYADCAGRTVSVKIARSHLPRRGSNPYRAVEDGLGGMSVAPTA